MEQQEQELVTPDGSYTLDIQPYIYEPAEATEQASNEEENDNSSDSSDSDDQIISQRRTQNTDW